jgi:hypothetical protein
MRNGSNGSLSHHFGWGTTRIAPAAASLLNLLAESISGIGSVTRLSGELAGDGIIICKNHRK